MTRIHDELRHKGLTTSAAKFVCALCIALPSGESQVFEGEVKGRLTFPPRGDHGFGYDPIFVADGMEQSFAEIDPAKQGIPDSVPLTDFAPGTYRLEIKATDKGSNKTLTESLKFVVGS